MRRMVLQGVSIVLLGCSAQSPDSRAETRAAEPSSVDRGARWGGLEVVERGRGDRVVVLLHGYGAPGDDLVSLGAQLADATSTRFVMPGAPLAWPGGGPGRMWFERSGPERDAQAASSARALEGVLETLRTEGASRIAVAGFSQGAMMSLERALRGETPAALVMLSGAAPAQLGTDWSRLRDVPVFVSHGRQDSILPFSGAEDVVQRAEAAGARVTFVPFDGGHAIPPVVVERLTEFLRTSLGA